MSVFATKSLPVCLNMCLNFVRVCLNLCPYDSTLSVYVDICLGVEMDGLNIRFFAILRRRGYFMTFDDSCGYIFLGAW